ncbi:MAG TPA: hypothetical protein VE442_01415 [Jatrophihabitans sp.]|nr:hypothetical protein [Jatrophihabitans sp.]
MEPTVELDHRRSADIEVSLLWQRDTNRLVVTARDHRTGAVLEIPVAPDQARNAFLHPYAYAASIGIVDPWMAASAPE